MTGVFPVWGRDTRQLVGEFEDLGFRAVLCCVEGAKLDASFVGRSLDRRLVADLPPGIDPAGENGEYHSFVYDGPIFERPLAIETGVVVTRDNRHYIDLLLAAEQPAADQPAAEQPARELSAAALPPV
jgi:diphthamide synthase (EF-2-diphthine--ammonia ligase)